MKITLKQRCRILDKAIEREINKMKSLECCDKECTAFTKVDYEAAVIMSYCPRYNIYSQGQTHPEARKALKSAMDLLKKTKEIYNKFDMKDGKIIINDF